MNPFREILSQLDRCSPESIAFNVRSSSHDPICPDILYWNKTKTKFDTEVEKWDGADDEGLPLEFSKFKADLQHDFNMMCYDAIATDSKTSQDSMNRKALNLLRHGQNVLCAQMWERYIVCLKCKKPDELLTCDFCYKTWHKACTDPCNPGQEEVVPHPLRYDGNGQKDACWFCTKTCSTNFQELIPKVSKNLLPADKPIILHHTVRTLTGNHEAYRKVLASCCKGEQYMCPGVLLESSQLNRKQKDALEEVDKDRSPVMVMFYKSEFKCRRNERRVLAKSKWEVCVDFMDMPEAYESALQSADEWAKGNSNLVVSNNSHRLRAFIAYFNGTNRLQDIYRKDKRPLKKRKRSPSPSSLTSARSCSQHEESAGDIRSISPDQERIRSISPDDDLCCGQRKSEQQEEPSFDAHPAGRAGVKIIGTNLAAAKDGCKVGLVYDPNMEFHVADEPKSHEEKEPERPQRTQYIFDELAVRDTAQ